MEDLRPSHGTVRFGAFEVDLDARELRKQGGKLKLQEQPFEILQILLQKPGEIVTREELRQKIWHSDTFVDFDHGLYNAIKRLREALGDAAETPHYVETLARRGYRFIGKIECESSRIRSLAVLPLENLSCDPDQEYFADGLTEALITTLAKIGELRVVSRTSVMQYKRIRKPLREVARELEVDAIVEGTVLRDGDRVRISDQLIDARTDTHLWAEGYERELRDILSLHSELVQAIAREVRVKLSAVDQARLSSVHAVDPEAYEAYLKGRYHWLKRSREGHVKAVKYFQEAIDKDGAWALAYAGLADAYSIMGLWGLVAPEDGCGKAKMLASKALDIDPELAEAHASLAWATAHYSYDFVTAEMEFERTLELNPRYATAHHWFGLCLAMTERQEEAIAEMKRAIRLDPHVSVIHWGLAFVYWCGRRYDEAIHECKQALTLDPNSGQAHTWLGFCHSQKGRHEPAIASLRRAVELSEGAALANANLGAAYAEAGLTNEAHTKIQELSSFAYIPKYFAAPIYSALGRKNEALRLLEAAYREHGEWVPLLKVDPRFDELRPEPRFQDLLRRMNFPS